MTFGVLLWLIHQNYVNLYRENYIVNLIMAKWYEFLLGYVFAFPPIYLSRDYHYITQFISPTNTLWSILGFIWIVTFIGSTIIAYLSIKNERKTKRYQQEQEIYVRGHIFYQIKLIIFGSILSVVCIFLSYWTTFYYILASLVNYGFSINTNIFDLFLEWDGCLHQKN